MWRPPEFWPCALISFPSVLAPWMSSFDLMPLNNSLNLSLELQTYIQLSLSPSHCLNVKSISNLACLKLSFQSPGWLKGLKYTAQAVALAQCLILKASQHLILYGAKTKTIEFLITPSLATPTPPSVFSTTVGGKSKPPIAQLKNHGVTRNSSLSHSPHPTSQSGNPVDFTSKIHPDWSLLPTSCITTLVQATTASCLYYWKVSNQLP